MTRYGEEFDIDQDKELARTIASYMDDEIREDLHDEMCPCAEKDFLWAIFAGLIRYDEDDFPADYYDDASEGELC